MTTPDRPGGIPDETWRAYLMVKARIDEESKPTITNEGIADIMSNAMRKMGDPGYSERAFDDAACQADNPASAVKQPITDRGIAEIMSNAMRKMGQPKREIDLLSRAIREAAMSHQDSAGYGPKTWIHLLPEQQNRKIEQMYWAIKRYHEIVGSELG